MVNLPCDRYSVFVPAIPILLLLATLIPPGGYRAADGTWVRRPHLYKRHPNAGTPWTGTCRDGSVTFAHSHTGACSHHGGVQAWR